MAIQSIGHDAPTAGIHPTVLKLREIYDRAPQSLGPVQALTSRPKVWCLAKWSEPWGWTPVARFATHGDATRHRAVLARATGQEVVISHYEDGAHLRTHELLINRLRLLTVAKTAAAAVQRIRRIDRATLEAQLWAARRGWKLTSRIHGGMVVLGINDWQEVQ